MRERQGAVVIDMLTHQQGDCMAGPTKRVTRVIDYLKPDPYFVSLRSEGSAPRSGGFS